MVVNGHLYLETLYLCQSRTISLLCFIPWFSVWGQIWFSVVWPSILKLPFSNSNHLKSKGVKTNLSLHCKSYLTMNWVLNTNILFIFCKVFCMPAGSFWSWMSSCQETAWLYLSTQKLANKAVLLDMKNVFRRHVRVIHIFNGLLVCYVLHI